MENEKYLSAVPFLPPLTEKTLKDYSAFYVAFCVFVVAFGGVLSPILKVRLGLGGA